MVGFWSVQRAVLGSKRTNGGVGFQDPKTAEMPTKQGKPNETATGLITGIGLKLDNKLL